MSFLTLFSTQAWGQNISRELSMYCLPLLHLGDWTDDAEKVTDQTDSVNIGCYLRTAKGELKPLLNPGPKALFLSDLAAALGSSSPTGTAQGLSPLLCLCPPHPDSLMTCLYLMTPCSSLVPIPLQC